MKLRFISVIAFTLSILSLSLAGAARLASAETVVLTLQPNQEASLPFSFWCMDYGKPFPTAIETQGDRASDRVIAVVRAALAKGTATTDPYQTQLAIWRELEGSYKDFANQGYVLAQQIYSDSLQIVVPPLPTGEATLSETIASGSVTTTVAGLTPTLLTTPTILAEQAFNGTGVLVVRNVTDKPLRFLVPEGLLFQPVGGTTAQQRLVAVPRGQPPLPPTGSDHAELPMESFAMFAAGISLFGIGVASAVQVKARGRRER